VTDGAVRARGHITLVQEDRFVLVTDGGEALLCTLAHDVHLPDGELRRLYAAGVRVVVEYGGQPGLASCVVHSVRKDG
jgi:hypothetical protein